jgi:hypothetical protein
MRHGIAIFIALVLALAPLACGGSSKNATSTATAGGVSVTAYFPDSSNDRDNDGDHNNDDAEDLNYGHAASPADRSAIVALVTNYYAAAAAENGRKACAMLVPFFAETVVERYGDQPAVSGRSCATVMSKLFRNHHADIATKQATLKIPDVRVRDGRALVILEFPAIREVRQLRLRHIAGGWRLLQLLDTIME